MGRERWNRRLTRVLWTRDGIELRTLADAAKFASDPERLPEHYQQRPHWQTAARLMMAAAQGGSIGAATWQIYKALFLDMRLDVTRVRDVPEYREP